MLAAFTVNCDAMGGRNNIEKKITEQFGGVRVDWGGWTELIVRRMPGPGPHAAALGRFIQLMWKSIEAEGLEDLIGPLSDKGTSSLLPSLNSPEPSR